MAKTKNVKSKQELALSGINGLLLKNALWGAKGTVSGLKLALQESLEELSMEHSLAEYETLRLAKLNLDKVVQYLVDNSKSKTDNLFEIIDELCLQEYRSFLINLLRALHEEERFYVLHKASFTRAIGTALFSNLRHEDSLELRAAVQESIFTALSLLQELLALVLSGDGDRTKFLLAVSRKVTSM